MLEIFGKEYRLDKLISSVILILSLVTICLNVLYFIKLDSSLINWNMGVGCILFIYSYWNLFVKTNKNSSD